MWHLYKGREAVLRAVLMRRIRANGHHGLLESAWTLKDGSPPLLLNGFAKGRSSAQLGIEKNRFGHYPDKSVWCHIETPTLQGVHRQELFLFLSLNRISAQCRLVILCFV